MPTVEDVLHQVNLCLRGPDGDCVLSLNNLHKVRALIKEAYDVGYQCGIQAAMEHQNVPE